LVSNFALIPGTSIAGKYIVLEELGRGVEGETYLVEERATKIERAAKLFYPERNRGGMAARASARMHHRLGMCSGVVRYVTYEEIFVEGRSVSVLVSEFVNGLPLFRFLKQQPDKRLGPFEALHFLRALAVALAELHQQDVAHGDVHDENIMLQRRGLGFDARLVDVAGNRHGWSKRDDVVGALKLFEQAVGGGARYQKMPLPVRRALGSMRRDRINARFPSAQRIVDALDNIDWGPLR